MNITQEQMQAAVTAGLVMSDPKSELMVPLKHAGGMLILHQVLASIAQGELIISQAPDPKDREPPMRVSSQDNPDDSDDA